MTDVLERLRDANPLPNPHAAPLPAPRDALPAPPRRRLIVGAGFVVVAAAIAISLVLSSGSVDMAARAYAAVAPGHAVIHWRDVITSPSGGKQMTEGWVTPTVRHVVAYDVDSGGPQVTSDMRVADGRQVVWTAGSDDVTSGPDIPDDPGSLPIDSDPAASFRTAYQAGSLREIDNSTFSVPIPPCCTGTYHVDPDTGVPTRFVFSGADGAGQTTVVDVTTYERLPETDANLAKLDWLPHPRLTLLGPAKEWFSALRSTRAPQGAERELLRRWMAGNTTGGSSASVDDARRLTGSTWLIPEGDRLCIANVTVSGVGGGVGANCGSVASAEHRGLSVDGIMAVPDGTTAVDITFKDGTHETDKVKNGVATFTEKLIAHDELK